MGKPKDPNYWRRWRAAHPEYRERERVAAIARHARRGPRGDRSAEYARRRSPAVVEPISALRPDLQHGGGISFWDDELRLDLAQERELARLLHRDPDRAAREYARRELTFHHLTTGDFDAVA